MHRSDILGIVLSTACFALGLVLIQSGLGWVRLQDAPVPFGISSLSTFGVLLIVATIMASIFRELAKDGVGRVALLALLLWAVVSLYYLYASNNMAYTSDIHGHLGRTQYSALHWFDPYGYRGWQDHHPPLYYIPMGIIYSLVDRHSNADPHTVMRFVSWVCHLIFLAYSILCLRHARLSRNAYEWSVVLLLLWPGGFHAASKIGNEPLYYAFYAASFYYALRWYREGHKPYLVRALLIAAVAFATRSNALVLFTLLACMMLVALYRRRLFFRDALTRPFLIAAGVILLCTAVNFAEVFRGEATFGGHLGYEAWYSNPTPFPLFHYFSVNWLHMLAMPYNDWAVFQGFWEYFVKSAIFGEYWWDSMPLARTLNPLMVFIAWYSFLPALTAKTFNRRELLPHLFNIVVPVAYIIIFTVITHNATGQDARYIYPSLISFAVFFGRSYELHERRGSWLLVGLGRLLVFAFVALSIYFFWNNPR